MLQGEISRASLLLKGFDVKYHSPVFLAGEKRMGLETQVSMGSSQAKSWCKTNIMEFVKGLRQRMGFALASVNPLEWRMYAGNVAPSKRAGVVNTPIAYGYN